MLLKEGLDFKYGARHLKRSVERFLVYPLSNLVATGQIGLGRSGARRRRCLDSQTDLLEEFWWCADSGNARPKEQPEAVESLSGGVGLPIPQATKAAKKSQSRGDKS